MSTRRSIASAADATGCFAVAWGDVPSKSTVDAATFASIAQDMAAHDAERETVIKQSREVQKASKQAIFALHRGDAERAGKLLETAQTKASELLPTVDAYGLRSGSFSSALEEYCEARTFEHFLCTGTVQSMAAVGMVNRDEYIGGIADLCGEIGRFVVLRATKRDTETVRHCHRVVSDIHGHLLDMDFRNGMLRKKYDGVKHTLRRIETILYELSLTQRTTAGHAEDEDTTA